jgi:NAD(P)-dependent dehydrogenase (short-subunit alcohol dehydrogenase family)
MKTALITGGAKGITINITGLTAEVEKEDNTIDVEDVEVN